MLQKFSKSAGLLDCCRQRDHAWLCDVLRQAVCTKNVRQLQRRGVVDNVQMNVEVTDDEHWRHTYSYPL